MKFNVKKLCLLVTLSMAFGHWLPERAWAQAPEPRTEVAAKAVQLMQQVQAAQKPPKSSPFGLDPFGRGPKSSPSRTGSGEIRKAAEAVRDAKGDDAKAAAQKALADLLSKSYDEDMAQREQELKQIEERLTKLRALLDRRRTKKQEIIDLQIKVALNEADGLGFYENERSAKSDFRVFYDWDSRTAASRVRDSSLTPTGNVPTAPPVPIPAPAADPEPAPSK